MTGSDHHARLLQVLIAAIAVLALALVVIESPLPGSATAQAQMTPADSDRGGASWPSFQRGIQNQGSVGRFPGGDGSIVWSHKESPSPGTGLAYAQGNVYLGTVMGRLIALDGTTGNRTWTYPNPYQEGSGGGRAGISTPPAAHNGTVYYGDDDKRVFALSAEDGSLLWRRNLRGDSGEIGGGPTVYRGMVFVVVLDMYPKNYTLTALDADTGETIWDETLPGDHYNSYPTTHNGTLYIGTRDGSIHAYDAETGEPRWHEDVGAEDYPGVGGGVTTTPAVASGRIVVAPENSPLHVLDTNGSVVWSLNESLGEDPSAPVVADGTIFVEGRAFSAYNLTTGEELWNVTKGSGTPVYANGTLYRGTMGRSFMALHAENGSTKWETRTVEGTSRFGSEPLPPAAGSGFVVANVQAESDSHLFAFDAGGPGPEHGTDDGGEGESDGADGTGTGGSGSSDTTNGDDGFPVPGPGIAVLASLFVAAGLGDGGRE